MCQRYFVVYGVLVIFEGSYVQLNQFLDVREHDLARDPPDKFRPHDLNTFNYIAEQDRACKIANRLKIADVDILSLLDSNQSRSHKTILFVIDLRINEGDILERNIEKQILAVFRRAELQKAISVPTLSFLRFKLFNLNCGEELNKRTFNFFISGLNKN